MHHIRNTLPEIKTKISTNLQKYQAELAMLGDVIGDSPQVDYLFNYQLFNY